MSFLGHRLTGICFGNVRSGVSTGSMSCHLLSCSALLCNSDHVAGGCITRGGPQPPPPEIQPSVNKGATYYGKNQSFAFTQPGLFFDLAELEAWDEIVSFYGSSYYAPRMPNHTTYMRLIKRDQIAHPFEGISTVTWTPADTSVYDDNWLGNLMPGGWCFTSRGIPEPMLGELFYEDAAKPADRPYLLDKTNASVRENWTPLCVPLNVYNESGVVIGTFDGLSYSAFFNAAAVKMPQRKRVYDPVTETFSGDHPLGVVPRDRTLSYLSSEPPWLNPQRQILSLELWVYLSATGGTVKSPRIATARWWHYTKGIEYLDSGNYDSPFNPYMFLNTELVPGFLNVPITFNLLQNGNNPDNLPTKVSNMRMDNFRMFLGA